MRSFSAEDEADTARDVAPTTAEQNAVAMIRYNAACTGQVIYSSGYPFVVTSC